MSIFKNRLRKALSIFAAAVVSQGFSQDPGGVSNSIAWWKANSGVSGSSSISSWIDQSGNGHHLTSTSGPTFIGVDENYNPSISFDGNDDYMKVLGGIFGTDTYTDLFVVIVNKSQAVNRSRVFYEELANQAIFASHLTWDNEHVYLDYGVCCDSSRIATNWGTNTNMNHIWTMTSSASNSISTGEKKAIFRDGLKLKTSNLSDVGTGNNRDFYLGARNASNRFHTGNISEVIIFNSIPNFTQMRSIHSYLSLKYGITLSDDENNNGIAFELDNSSGLGEGDYVNSIGNIIWDASQNNDYHHNVIGIGRDDNSNLTQYQSHDSQDSSRIYTSTLANSNTSNTGSFTSNLQFIIMGNNQGQMNTTTSANAEKPTSVPSRIEREFKITNTNFDGTFSIALRLNSFISPIYADPANLLLLIDSDDDFSDAISYSDSSGISFSFNSGVISISGITTSHIPSNTIRYLTIGNKEEEFSISMALPIELISFDSYVTVNNQVDLTWTTASEINNDYFNIERSGNGLEWQNIYEVNGAGNSTTEIDYSYVDKDPLPGVSYYRLKQTDFDGNFTYSDIQSVNIELNSNLNIFPNPSESSINITLTNLSDIKVFDIFGREVSTSVHYIYEEDHRAKLDISLLPSGSYILKSGNHIGRFSKR